MMIDYQGNPIWVKEINITGYIQLEKTYDNAFAFMTGPPALGRTEDLENLSGCFLTNQTNVNTYTVSLQVRDAGFTVEDITLNSINSKLIKAPSEIKIDDCS